MTSEHPTTDASNTATPDTATPDTATPDTAADTAPRDSGKKRARKTESKTLWLSRASFLLSGVALVSVGYRSLEKQLEQGEPIAPKAVAMVRHAAELMPRVIQPQRPAPVTSEPGAAESPKDFVPRVREKIDKGLAALRIKRLVVTQAVEDREPVAVSEVDAETPVIAFVEVASGSPEDQQVVVTFEHEAGQQVGLVNLSVPGNKPRWRTWGRTYNVKRGGRWVAVVRDSRGEELGRTEFTVRRTS